MQDYPHITARTRDLLDHWRDEDRERRLFFCQIEAAETAIYLTEAAEQLGDTKALNVIRAENAQLNGGLPRLAFKMATGSGKTVVMAMLIAWQALNKQANPQDRRFSDRFLIVTPGITIRDRLRVLLPNDPENYYRAHGRRDPGAARPAPGGHRRHHELPRLHPAREDPGREPDEEGPRGRRWTTSGSARRPPRWCAASCREFGSAKNIVVLNDEAHHCYAPAPKEQAEEGALDADERTHGRARTWRRPASG